MSAASHRPPQRRDPPIRGLFVTGTDTGVGKTAVAAELIRHLVGRGHRVGAIKPIVTGATEEGGDCRWEDVDRLREVLGEVEEQHLAPIRFKAPLAPSVAARLEGNPLTFATVLQSVRESLSWWAGRADLMIVEGIGGLLCPLAEDALVVDLATWLDYPLVVIVRRDLGTLNHTLLTVEAARSRGLRVAGVVLNGAEPTKNELAEATNREELSRFLGEIPILAEIPFDVATEDKFSSLRSVDWESWAQSGRIG